MVRHGVEQGPALTQERRFAAGVAALGVALFALCCALVRGGLFSSAQYGDVGYYARYAHEMAQGHWPYRDFFDEYPPLAQPLFLFVHALPGSFATVGDGPRYRVASSRARSSSCSSRPSL